MSAPAAPIRVVLAKVGLDGHDRGIKVVARALRDAGMQVIYAGLWQTPEAVVRAIADEDADWLGLSILSGAHMTLVPRVLELLRAAGFGHVGVLVGGIIPEPDVPRLLEMGVARVFGPGTTLPEIVAFLQERREARMLDELLERFARRDRQALSRLLSHLSRGEQVGAILAGLPRPVRPSRVVALTGGGGVGKSTLAGKVIDWLRGRAQTVAVLACDPESPLTGGALLGDRFRMGGRPDDGVFIRSLATPSGRGAVADHLAAMIDLLEAFGFDWILVETVGAGQGDTAVRGLVDVLVLLLQPEAGDDVQWEKAGVMEVADVVAVNKADLPGADLAVAQVRASLALSGAATAVLPVSSRSGVGVAELGEAMAARPLRRRVSDAGRRHLLRLAQELLERRFAQAEADPRLEEILTRWQRGTPATTAAADLLGWLAQRP